MGSVRTEDPNDVCCELCFNERMVCDVDVYMEVNRHALQAVAKRMTLHASAPVAL